MDCAQEARSRSICYTIDQEFPAAANGPGSTPSGTFELDTDYQPFVYKWNVQQLVNSNNKQVSHSIR